MKKLINLSTDPWDTNKFSKDPKEILRFMKMHGFDGLEIIQSFEKWDAAIIPNAFITGLHMPFWPIWLDFWNGHEKELESQFGSLKTAWDYYGGKDQDIFIQKYLDECRSAKKMEAEYVVFHVSHVQLDHSYSWQFTYSDEEVMVAFVDMVNQVLEKADMDCEILLENLWWPGFRLKDAQQVDFLLDRINYEKTGIMLDIGHLMISNHHLQSEKEAVKYILKKIDSLGESREKIKGIHLNSSLSGDYIKKIIRGEIEYADNESFAQKFGKSFSHISNIDRHEPFLDKAINQVIKEVDPNYLVLELMDDTLEKLNKKIAIQNSILDL